ncbi:MAG: FkbM family methyltransferase [Candidatus Margulisbacteria bacterium]|nr:FkbM family methyltransferase [Candidatus Margulisiibacteriota bacterium]
MSTDIFRRFSTVRHWLAGSRNGVSLAELIKKTVDSPCSIKARAKIKEIVPQGEFYRIIFKGNKAPFYFPASIPLFSLYRMVAESLYPDDWHYYEIAETRVGGNDVVVDCGAAEGLFTFLTAKKCKRVYAIEPLSQFVEALKLNRSGFDNVEILQYALSDEAGEGKISKNDICSSLTDAVENVETVKIRTIDQLFFERGLPVSYLKADLEGYELKMLNGAIKTIKAFKPKIAITTYHRVEHARQIANFLEDLALGYKIKCKGIEAYSGAPVMLHAWVE